MIEVLYLYLKDFQKRFKYLKLRPQETVTFRWFNDHNNARISTFAGRKEIQY